MEDLNMKSKTCFLLPLVFSLSIVACSNPVSSNNEQSSLEPATSQTSTNPKKNLPPKEIDVYQEGQFKLEDFPFVKFSIGPKELNADGNKYVYPLYVNDVKVTDDRPRYMWAYDVNKDGYRELVFRYEESPRSFIRSFDVYNMKEMPYKGKRQSICEFYKEEGSDKLRIRSYAASTINKIVFDYADMAYSEEKGFHFIWDNMYQFTDFKLNQILDNGMPIEMINNAYKLQTEKDYIFEIAAPRVENPTLELTDFERQTGFNVYVDDQLYGVNKFYYQDNQNDIYRFLVNFTSKNPVKEFTYLFQIPAKYFEINIRLFDAE